MRRVSIAFGCMALGLLATGCKIARAPRPQRINTYLAEPGDLDSIRRIMVLPFSSEASTPANCEGIRDAFLTELQKIRRFEVVPLPDTAQESRELRESLRTGRLSAPAMVRLCNRYSLDGVFVGTVVSWRPYRPPHLGMRTYLFSVHSAEAVWAVDAMFDTNDLATISDLRDYTRRVLRDDGNLHGWELTLLSPSMFTKYVAHRFVTTWIAD